MKLSCILFGALLFPWAIALRAEIPHETHTAKLFAQVGSDPKFEDLMASGKVSKERASDTGGHRVQDSGDQEFGRRDGGRQETYCPKNQTAYFV